MIVGIWRLSLAWQQANKATILQIFLSLYCFGRAIRSGGCLRILLSFVSCLQTKTPEANMVVGIWRLSLTWQQDNKAMILYLLVMDCKFAAALVGMF